VYAAARTSGRRLTQWIDFSASINPLGPSPRAIRAIVSALDLTSHYPDPDCVALRQALAAHYRCAPEQLLIGNGSTEFIHLLPRILPIRRALIIGPAFAEYARAVSLAGGRLLSVNATRDEQYRPPFNRVLETLRKEGTDFDAVFLCQPNSPTGLAWDVEHVLELIHAAQRRQASVIVDETFVEYCQEQSVLPLLNRMPNVLVLRSFTKFYALPALRAGCLVGSAKVVRRFRHAQPPWSVNTLSQAAVLSSITDIRYAARSRVFMERERPRFSQALESLPGITVFPSKANFLLLELPVGHSAPHIATALRQRGVLIRDCSRMEALTSRMIRVAVKTTSENQRLVAMLRRVLM
jgi:threonine-phosphate decarboxylase